MGQTATIQRPLGPPPTRIRPMRVQPARFEPVTSEIRPAVRQDAPVSFRAGEALYREGELATAVFVLLGGRVRLSNQVSHGPAVVTGPLRPGALFGVDSLSGSAYGETARAESDCLVRIVPISVLDLLLGKLPGFAAGLLEALVRRRSAAERLLTRALITGVPGRMAGALLDAADGGAVTGHTRQELAEAAWTTRETATRMLFQFVDEGLVRVDGRCILLIEPERLRQLANGVRQLRAA